LASYPSALAALASSGRTSLPRSLLVPSARLAIGSSRSS
jgi:hypothetical protein